MKGIRGKLRRFEFIEFFVRLGKSAWQAMSPSLSLIIFINTFLKPIADKSTFLHERDLIKACFPLNKSLFENRGGLNWIFDKMKGENEMIEKTVLTAYMKKLMAINPDL